MSVLEFNDAEVDAIYAALAARLENLTPAMQDIGEAWLTSTEGRFAQSVAPDGTPWAPKSATTMARYDALGGNSLRQPLIGPSRMLSTTIFSETTSESVSLGSSRIQAAVMQFGAKQGEFGARMGRTKPSEKRPWSQDYFMPIPWGDIPARPFLGVSEDDNSMIREVLTEYLQGLPA